MEGAISLLDAELVAEQIGTLTPREAIEMIRILLNQADPEITAIARGVRAWAVSLLRYQATVAEWKWVERTRQE